jgi:hypothetical protein
MPEQIFLIGKPQILQYRAVGEISVFPHLGQRFIRPLFFIIGTACGSGVYEFSYEKRVLPQSSQYLLSNGTSDPHVRQTFRNCIFIRDAYSSIWLL